MQLDDNWPPAEPVAAETPRRHRHVWMARYSQEPAEIAALATTIVDRVCRLCGRDRDEAKARRGRQSRNYGNRAELAVARKYGGEKIGAAGGPVDVRGAEFNVQVKTHRRLPPAEWRKAFGAMAANRERIPRLLLRFLPGPGLPPDDYFVFRADDFLDWFGRDEEAPNV